MDEKQESESGYCGCPQLAHLFRLRRQIEERANQCDMFARNIDLANPRPGDKKFLEDYKKATDFFEGAVRTYTSEVRNLLDKGPLKIKGRANKTSLISVYCSSCKQQIETATHR